MTSRQYHRLTADEIELRRLPASRQMETRLNGDDRRNKTRSFASASALQSNVRVVGNGKPGFFALGKTPSLPHAQNEKTLVGNVWNPGVWAQFPWAGFGALMLVVAFTGAAVAVLAVSNGSPVRDWQVRGVTIQPQVWLSVLATLMDSLVLYALVKGATITFWKRSMYGANLRHLYDIFESTGFVGALNGVVRRRFSTVALACILASVSALRGPLFQRATLINEHAQLEKNGTMELRMAQILPPGYLYGSGFVFSGSFSQLYTAFGTGDPIPFSYPECGDSCITTIKGFGFSVNCSTVPVSNDEAKAGFRSKNVTTIGSAIPIFNVSSSLHGELECDDDESCFAKNKAAAELGRIEIANLFKAAPNCESDVSLTRCTLQQAIVEYWVVLQDGIISLQHPHWQNDTILYNTPPWDEPESLGYDSIMPWWSSSMNWVNFFMLQFNEELDRYADGELGPASFNPVFRLALQSINDDAVNSLNSINCNATFDDPSQYVVDRMREIAFRTSVAAATVTNNTILFGNDSLVASGLPLIQNWTQTVLYTGRSAQIVYSVSTAYLISAVVVSLLGVVAIAPLYWGWWELGRDVSFNPLEVAKAFHAEIMRDANWNMNKEGLVKVVGEREVSYRVVDEGVKEESEDIADRGGEEQT